MLSLLQVVWACAPAARSSIPMAFIMMKVAYKRLCVFCCSLPPLPYPPRLPQLLYSGTVLLYSGTVLLYSPTAPSLFPPPCPRLLLYSKANGGRRETRAPSVHRPPY